MPNHVVCHCYIVIYRPLTPLPCMHHVPMQITKSSQESTGKQTLGRRVFQRSLEENLSTGPNSRSAMIQSSPSSSYLDRADKGNCAICRVVVGLVVGIRDTRNRPKDINSLRAFVQLDIRSSSQLFRRLVPRKHQPLVLRRVLVPKLSSLPVQRTRAITTLGSIIHHTLSPIHLLIRLPQQAL